MPQSRQLQHRSRQRRLYQRQQLYRSPRPWWQPYQLLHLRTQRSCRSLYLWQSLWSQQALLFEPKPAGPRGQRLTTRQKLV